MTDRTDAEIIRVLRMACSDLRKGLLTEGAFTIVADSILNPAGITAEDMRWAKEAVKDKEVTP